MSINKEKNSLIQITLNKELVRKLEDYIEANGFTTKSIAISFLITYALNHLEEKDTTN